MMTVKTTVGYLFTGQIVKQDKLFLEEAKKKNINLVLLNLSYDVDEKKIEELIAPCDVIYNATSEDFGIELVKTMESLGKKVLESSKAYYYSEDKWLFFLRCREDNIPVPETILLSENESMIKSELKEFGKWPVVLKRSEGTMGQFVDKAENVNEALKIVNRFWKKGGRESSIIAQEMIHSPSYRVTVIDGKIVQTALKENKSWKSTGVYARTFKRFEVDKKLNTLVNKITKLSGIKICGIDFLRKGDDWVVLEVNSAPGLDFYEDEMPSLIGKVLDCLVGHAKK